MSRFHSYLNSSKEILSRFKGDEPFASYLKKYFSANKKMGSKDRKQVSNLCYSYFRLGKWGQSQVDISLEERILIGVFLCSHQSNDLLANLKPEWNERVSLSVEEKATFLGYVNLLKCVFPFTNHISTALDLSAFVESFFIQPDFFVRLRPGKASSVKAQLEEAGIDYKVYGNDCLAVANTVKLDAILNLNTDAVVQDLSSQQTVSFFTKYWQSEKKCHVWDCCAASGGKSILLKDLMPTAVITVSDIREKILINLKNRFAAANVHYARAIVTDLSKQAPFTQDFDLVMADVPCSGSGTWSRTPEQLHFFTEEKIQEYAILQRSILQNVLPAIKQQGYLLYITCSVFAAENEQQLAYLQEQGLELKESHLITGYSDKADTLFVGILQKV